MGAGRWEYGRLLNLGFTIQLNWFGALNIRVMVDTCLCVILASAPEDNRLIWYELSRRYPPEENAILDQQNPT
eukprot:967574-Amphidinium_carterae.1